MENSPYFITGNITSATPPTTDRVVMNAAPTGRLTIQLLGTWVGTVQFEGTLDGTNFFALNVQPIAGGATVTSATANGQWTFNGAVTKVQCRCSAFTSGPIVANILGIV